MRVPSAQMKRFITPRVSWLTRRLSSATVASDAKPEINDSGLRQSPSAVGPTQAENDKNTRVSCDKSSGLEAPAKIPKAWHDSVSNILEKNGDEDDPTAPAAQPSASSASRPEGIPAPFLGSGKWQRILRPVYMCFSEDCTDGRTPRFAIG